MTPEILLAREKDGYRVLHGHLRLINILKMCNEATVEVSGEGKIKIVKTRKGIFVGEEDGSGGYLLFSPTASYVHQEIGGA